MSKPVTPPPPTPIPDPAEIRTENRHRNQMQWLKEIDNEIGTIKIIVSIMLLVNMTTCAATCADRTLMGTIVPVGR